jgi:PTS system ascorbate-specific IIA component
MPGLLILAHAPLASALKAVAEHAFPDCAARVGALDVLPTMPVEEIESLGPGHARADARARRC